MYTQQLGGLRREPGQDIPVSIAETRVSPNCRYPLVFLGKVEIVTVWC